MESMLLSNGSSDSFSDPVTESWSSTDITFDDLSKIFPFTIDPFGLS